MWLKPTGLEANFSSHRILTTFHDDMSLRAAMSTHIIYQPHHSPFASYHIILSLGLHIPLTERAGRRTRCDAIDAFYIVPWRWMGFCMASAGVRR